MSALTRVHVASEYLFRFLRSRADLTRLCRGVKRINAARAAGYRRFIAAGSVHQNFDRLVSAAARRHPTGQSRARSRSSSCIATASVKAIGPVIITASCVLSNSEQRKRCQRSSADAAAQSAAGDLPI